MPKKDYQLKKPEAAPVADYSQYKTPAKATEGLKELSIMAESQRSLETELSKAEDEVKRIKKELEMVAMVQLPNLMDNLEMSEFTTKDGLKVKIEENLRANIPKARAPEAIKWLDDNGHSGLVKRKFIIMFTKADETWAKKFERDCAQRKKPLDCAQEKSVHHRTLSSFIKEQLEAGIDIPMDVFGVFRQRVAKVHAKTA